MLCVLQSLRNKSSHIHYKQKENGQAIAKAVIILLKARRAGVSKEF